LHFSANSVILFREYHGGFFPMTLTVVSIVALAVALAVILGLLVRSLAKLSSSDRNQQQWSPVWFAEFSASAYRPLTRLLSEDDFRFLSRQAGYTAELGKKLRRERRLVFRAYLRNLIRDFNRLYKGAAILVVHSEVDRPELASSLLRIRANFYYALCMVQFRLALHAAGVEMMDVTPILQSLEFLQVQVTSLQPEGMAA
jgi:hypothetical protein